MVVIDQSPAPPLATRLAPSGPHRTNRWEQALTGLLVFGPMAGAVWAFARVAAQPPSRLDLALALGMYLLTGFGVTIGFHRMLTHRAFVAIRPLRVALAVAGSMAFEGPLIGWVADHRRHHAFTDRPGDPHSPFGLTGPLAGVRGALHAHTGWLFCHDPTDPRRYARDLLTDRDLEHVSRLFPLWCIVSLALPFGAGWWFGGSLAAAGSALLWAGLVRIAVLHQVTWSINSLCHLVGRRPYDTKDRSANVALLSVVSFGESFHNNHHAFPRSARHGVRPGELDPAGALIGLFRRMGWATEVHRAGVDTVAGTPRTMR